MVHQDEFLHSVELSYRSFMHKWGYIPKDLYQKRQRKGMFEVVWLENEEGKIIIGPFHEVDFFDHSIAQWIKDPRNLTLEENEFLEPFRKEVVEYYGYEKWDELIKGAIAKARQKGNIVSGPGEGKSQRRDNFNPGAFMS